MDPKIAYMIRCDPKLTVGEIKRRVKLIQEMRVSEHYTYRALVENQIVAMSNEVIRAVVADHPQAKEMAEEAIKVF